MREFRSEHSAVLDFAKQWNNVCEKNQRMFIPFFPPKDWRGATSVVNGRLVQNKYKFMCVVCNRVTEKPWYGFKKGSSCKVCIGLKVMARGEYSFSIPMELREDYIQFSIVTAALSKMYEENDIQSTIIEELRAKQKRLQNRIDETKKKFGERKKLLEELEGINVVGHDRDEKGYKINND